MSRHLLPTHGHARLTVLHRLVATARIDRRRRLRERFAVRVPASGDLGWPDDLRRRRASLMLERILRARSSGTVDCARFFTQLATCLQLASSVIRTIMSSVGGGAMDAGRASELATVIADLVHYFEATVPMGGTVLIYLAIAQDDDLFVVGVAAEGDVGPISTASASAAMLRARRIVRLMQGDFQRGVAGDRLVFGLTFPTDFAEPVRP